MVEYETLMNYPESGERLVPQHDVIPWRLVKLAKRLAMLRAGQAYSITVWMPEDRNSEPVWSINELGKVENNGG